MNDIHQVKNLAKFFEFTSKAYSDKPAFFSRKKDGFSAISYKELYEQGLCLATGLIELGLKPRSHVAVLADNRVEWMLTEYAIQICAGVNVPRGTDITFQELKYILNHAQCPFVFVENTNILEQITANKGEFKYINNIIVIEEIKGANKAKDIHSLNDVLEQGKALRAKGDTRAEETMAQLKPEDLFTIIYTSGTTGTPKGVMLNHANIMSEIKNIPIHFTSQDRMLSILPIWHVFERQYEMVTMSKGASTYYTDIRNIKQDMQIARPTFMAAAPRLWEKVYLGIEKKIENAPAVRKGLFYAAYFCAKHFKSAIRFLTFSKLDIVGDNPLLSLLQFPFYLSSAAIFLLPYLLLDFIVLRKIRAATGGALRYTVSGGGALPPHVDIFFNDIGIGVLEGYGMTETTSVLSVRLPSKIVIGTVGPLWPETELRLVDIETGDIVYPKERGRKGEIQVKGPQIMQGYYKDEESTKKVLKDGWLSTGDLAIITYNNMIKIVGRSKETIVLLGGDNVEPNPLEMQILQLNTVEHCMVTGQDRKQLSCLVVPSLEGLAEYGSTYQEIAASLEARERVLQEIKLAVNEQSGFKAFERITDCRLLPKAFEVGVEMTATFKLKRIPIADTYAELIDSMYI